MAIRARLLGLRQGYPSLNTSQLVEKAGYVMVEKLVPPRFPKPDPLSESRLPIVPSCREATDHLATS
jgi:hypothetical protein